MTELKPCPICGGHPYLAEYDGAHYVVCNTCWLMFGILEGEDADPVYRDDFRDIETCIKAWNTRVGDEDDGDTSQTED